MIRRKDPMFPTSVQNGRMRRTMVLLWVCTGDAMKADARTFVILGVVLPILLVIVVVALFQLMAPAAT